MTVVQPDAFILLNLPNATLKASSGALPQTGTLYLECVTVVLEGLKSDRDVYLVLRLDGFETALDPSKTISLSISDNGVRTYTFHDSPVPQTQGSSDLILSFQDRNQIREDMDTFDGILAQYADDFRRPRGAADDGSTLTDHKNEDLRGHLVLVDEDNGQILGALDNKLNVHEDPALRERGTENDPVVIELPEDDGTSLGAHEMFVRAIPPGEHDWITKGASLVSQAISSGTSLLLTGVSRASDYYISNSTPSPHSSGSNSRPSTSSASASTSAPVKPLPVAFLTSERTRRGLTQAHAVSGQAVKVSQKTVSIVEGLVKRVVGGGSEDSKAKSKQRERYNQNIPSSVSADPQSSGMKPPLPPRKAPSPMPSIYDAPPPYTQYTSNATITPNQNEKPTLPQRRSPFPLPSSHTAPGSTSTASTDSSPSKLSTKERLILSADLILSTLDNSTKKIFDVGSENLGKVVGHKYGPSAGHNAHLLAHTGRNVALVYIDMRGIGRKALLKTAGKEWVKTQVRSKKADTGEASISKLRDSQQKK